MAQPAPARQAIDLSHEIADGMITHPGIPGPVITAFLTHETSAGRYAPGTTFEIMRIEMVANTGTYLDTPAHRYPGASDLSSLALGRVVDLPGGWDRHWGTPAYLADNPFLTGDAAMLLVDAAVAAVGIDSLNVDSLDDPSRPAHSALLAAGIPLVEHLCSLDQLPADGFRFFAAPPRVAGMATFPVRAFALVDPARP